MCLCLQAGAGTAAKSAAPAAKADAKKLEAKTKTYGTLLHLLQSLQLARAALSLPISRATQLYLTANQAKTKPDIRVYFVTAFGTPSGHMSLSYASFKMI